MTKLKSMTAYVLELEETLGRENSVGLKGFTQKVSNYAKFLSMPLELKMFVPCDSENNVLEKELFSPIWEDYHNKEGGNHELYLHNLKIYNEYQKALSEVIFEGFKMSLGEEAVSNNENCIMLIHNNGKYSVSGLQVIKIEDLVKYNLKLTPKAKLKWIKKK